MEMINWKNTNNASLQRVVERGKESERKEIRRLDGKEDIKEFLKSHGK